MPFTAVGNTTERLGKPIGLVVLRDALSRYQDGPVLVVFSDDDHVRRVPLRQALEEHE